MKKIFKFIIMNALMLRCVLGLLVFRIMVTYLIMQYWWNLKKNQKRHKGFEKKVFSLDRISVVVV